MANLSNREKAILEAQGYLQGSIPLSRIPRKTFYTLDKRTKELVVMKDLPADPYSMARFLGRGFVLDPRELETKRPSQTVGTNKVTQEGGYVCQVCKRSFARQVSLAGHMNKHNKSAGGLK